MHGFSPGCLNVVHAVLTSILCGMLMGAPLNAQNKAAVSPKPDAIFGFYTKVLVETELKDARSAVDYWMKKVGKRVGLEIEGHIYESLDSFRNDFQKGAIDWINISPSDYLDIRNDVEEVLGPSPIMGGSVTRRYLLIIKSDPSISGIGDLKGKRLAVTEDNEGGRIYLNSILWENKLDEIASYFGELVERRTFGQVVLSVFFGQADACVATDYSFDTLVKLNPQLQNELKVISVSPLLIHSISIFRKNLDERIRRTIEHEVCNLDKSVEGNQVLTLFKIDGMVPIQSSDLDSFVELYNKYLKLMPDKIKTAHFAESK